MSVVAGTADILDQSAPRRRGPQIIAGALAILAGLVLWITRADDDVGGAAAPLPRSAATSTDTQPSSPPTTTSFDPADRTRGELPASLGAASGQTALRAAEAVANGYCLRIASWRIQLLPDVEDGYLEVRARLRPSGPAYPDVLLEIDLQWDTDHYVWSTPRQPLLDCP